MDPHRLAKERSIAYHTAIAERLQRQPEILAKAPLRGADLKKRFGVRRAERPAGT